MILLNDYPEFDPSIAKEYGKQGFSGPDFMGIPIFQDDQLIQLLIRFGFNMLICWVIIRYFYYRKNGRREFLFTFTLFALTIFLLIFLCDSVKMQIGMALGLFAIFGILRYRTEQVSIREMTYMFVIIGISAINGLAQTLPIIIIVTVNLFFVIAIAILESGFFVKYTGSKAVLYEKIELIHPSKRAELLEDLKTRTGLNITRVEIGHIDFLRDVVFLKVYYHPDADNISNSIDSITRLNDIS